MKLISWNVNGLRSAYRKGLLKFMINENADAYCFQEIKSKPENAPEIKLEGYDNYWFPAKKKGYSGVLIISRLKPLSVRIGIGNEAFDNEGRSLTLEFKDYYLINVYLPHSGWGLVKLNKKKRFNEAFLKYCQSLNKPLIIAGDYNVAHKDIDLANPKQNTKNPGFTNEERDFFTKLLGAGYIDTFREFVKEGGHYSWWAYRNNARKRNVGWRVDYFLISNELRPRLINSEILDKVTGSDHCPIRLTIK